MAAPIVGEISIGIRLAWRSFQVLKQLGRRSRGTRRPVHNPRNVPRTGFVG